MNGFATRRKRLVQANACSGRPSRPSSRDAMGGPAHHGHRAAAAGASLCFGSFRTCLALGRGCLVLEREPGGFFTGPAQCAFGPASCLVSFVLCAARGQRVLRGTEWTLCAPGRVRRASVQRVRFRRRARGSSQKIGARATPTLNKHCARTCCSQRVRCGGRSLLPSSGGGGSRSLRRSSLGRWRCGSCAPG